MEKKKKNKKNKKRNIIIISVLVLIVAGISLKFVFSSGVKPVEVTVETVAKREIVHKVTASGKILPEKQVEISANISALIMEISVEEGDSVMMGQHLISLDRMRYEAASEQAHSRLKSAEANLVKNTAMRDRAEKLFSEQLISSQEIESSTASFQLAESEVEMTRASLKSAMDDLSKTSLLAPSNGIVTEVRKEEGEMALGSMFQADVIMSIADLSKMEVHVDVNENDVVSVEIGDISEIEIDAFQDTLFYGVVKEIAHIAQTAGLGTQEQVTNFKVKVRMIDVPEGIRPGMSATANIVTDKRVNVLAIPIQSLTVRPVGSEKQMSPDKGVSDNESEERSKAKVQEFEELI
ncbi:MAG TPA: efflux RND transporter periplasmic adaptor subunit, partial [Candidatus Marinimicrobia bacterium]|nr:efflux RND transporter periplasmic adaptor subunit [Candidatus Neomarinimicrobiota bacterium]